MRLEIEDARRDDLERLTEIYSCYDLHRIKQDAENYVKCYLEHWHIKVARIDGIVQGACFWRPEGEAVWGLGWIEDLWVEPGFRNKGFGEKLLSASISDAKRYFESRGFKLRMFALTVQENNAPARAVYERLGFRKVTDLTDIYIDGEDALFYVLDFR